MRRHAPHLVVPGAPCMQALLATFATIAMLELDLGNTLQHGLNLVIATWFALLIRPVGGSKAEAWTISDVGSSGSRTSRSTNSGARSPSTS